MLGSADACLSSLPSLSLFSLSLCLSVSHLSAGQYLGKRTIPMSPAAGFRLFFSYLFILSFPFLNPQTLSHPLSLSLSLFGNVHTSEQILCVRVLHTLARLIWPFCLTGAYLPVPGYLSVHRYTNYGGLRLRVKVLTVGKMEGKKMRE